MEATGDSVIDVEFADDIDERDLLIQDIAKAQKRLRTTYLDWETAKLDAKEAKENHDLARSGLDELVSELTGATKRPLFERAKPKPKPEPAVSEVDPEDADDDDDFVGELDEDDDADDGGELASLAKAWAPLAIEGPTGSPVLPGTPETPPEKPKKSRRKKEAAAT